MKPGSPPLFFATGIKPYSQVTSSALRGGLKWGASSGKPIICAA